MKELVYLASPYSHQDSNIREERFQLACEYAARLFMHGFLCLSPIAHTHPIAKHIHGDHSWSMWAEFDIRLIDICDSVCFAMIDGWKTSIGMQEEYKYAKKNHKVIYLMDSLFQLRNDIILPDTWKGE